MSDIFIFENTTKNERPWRMNRSKASTPDVCNSLGAIVSWSRLKSFFKLLWQLVRVGRDSNRRNPDKGICKSWQTRQRDIFSTLKELVSLEKQYQWISFQILMPSCSSRLLTALAQTVWREEIDSTLYSANSVIWFQCQRVASWPGFKSFPFWQYWT